MKRGMRVAAGKVKVDRTDERILLKESVAAFVERTGGPTRARALRDSLVSIDRAIWHEMAELGWLAVTLPEQYGGLGLSPAEMAVITEELGGSLAPEPITEAITLAAGLLSKVGGPVANEILPRVASGDLIPALAWQEINGSYDPAAIMTTVETHANGEAKLCGVKTFVPHADTADGFIVTAMSEQGPVLYWVPANSLGVDISLYSLADGSKVGRVAFNQVNLKESQRISSGNDSVRVLTEAIDEATVMACVSLVGLMSKVLDMTLEYMKVRVQFGKPIGTFQALQHRAVDLYIQRELSKAALSDAIRSLDNADDASARCAVSRAKARCSDAALEICRESIQLHGAIAYTDEYDIGLFLNRALVLSAWLGNSSYHRRRYAIAGKQLSQGAAS